MPGAVVTNLDGVGYRYAQEQRGAWARAARHPTVETVPTRRTRRTLTPPQREHPLLREDIEAYRHRQRANAMPGALTPDHHDHGP